METLIICESIHHGNTMRVAEFMARQLNAKVVRPSKFRNASDIGKYDLIGFGSGIYHGMHHPDLLALARMLEGKGKKAFIFTTSGSRLWIFNMYRGELRQTLEKRGFDVLGEFSCPGWDSWGLLGLIGGLNKGRPDESDLEKAKRFARTIVERKGRPGASIP